MRFTVPFLGERKYVQGASVLDALDVLLSSARQIDVRFSRPMTRNVLEVVPDSKDSPCTIELTNIGGRQSFGVREVAENPQREPYDESAALSGAWFRDSQAGMKVRNFADVVALNKAFLHRVSPPDPSKQYLFARLEIDDYPFPWGEIELAFATKAGPLFVSTLSGACSGKVYFVSHTKL